MSHTEESAKTPSPRTGISATLRGLLYLRGTGALNIGRGTGAPARLILATLAGALAALALGASAALAIGGGTPGVGGESASNVTPFAATLGATISSNNEATEYDFEYSTSEAEVLAGHGIPVGAGTLPGNGEQRAVGPVSIGPLIPQTTYYYRVVATNPAGTTDGAVQSFLTPSTEKPHIEAESAAQTSATTAALMATVDPAYQPVTVCEFQYVSQEEFEQTGFAATEGTPAAVPCDSANLGEGGSGVIATASVEGLTPNTVYYYRLAATNATGTSYGEPVHAMPPRLGSVEAVGITAGSAVITGSVNGEGLPTRWEVLLGTNPAALEFAASGHIESSGNTERVVGPTPIERSVEGLSPGTVYYYKVMAVNPDGEALPAEGQFTTQAVPPPVGLAPVITMPLLTHAPYTFPKEEVTTTKAIKCPKGKKLSHGKCLKVKSKKKGKKK